MAKIIRFFAVVTLLLALAGVLSFGSLTCLALLYFRYGVLFMIPEALVGVYGSVVSSCLMVLSVKLLLNDFRLSAVRRLVLYILFQFISWLLFLLLALLYCNEFCESLCIFFSVASCILLFFMARFEVIDKWI